MQGLSPFTGTSRFELRRQLGEGGFGIVYEALDRRRDIPVALKLLRQADGAPLLRFKREFRTLSDVSHPNLVSLYELVTDKDHWFFTMELVDGVPMTAWVRQAGGTGGEASSGLTVDTALLKILPQLVDAVCALHRLGIVHRDIKPSNVLVTPDGRVVLLDFGLLSEHDPAADEDFSLYPSSGLNVLGTPAYMAPEQGTAEGAAPEADWYSVGVMLYEALTGRLPFTGSAVDCLEAKLAGPPASPQSVNPAAHEDLSAICMGLIAVEPGDRADAIARLQAIGRVADRADPASPAAVSDIFVGRESHLVTLQRAYLQAMQGTAVVALVAGVSGMGKTALVRQFLAEQRREEPDLIALTSRCYQRESTPYKAVDPLIDAVARYLRRLKDIEVARLLPRDAALLGRLFPVLRAVDEVRRVPEFGTAGIDSITVRRRAAIALRDLLFELAVREPLVLWIDDAQWGDADSAAILEPVLQAPDAPPLLLVASYRAEDASDAPLVAAFSRMARQPNAPRFESLSVGPLSGNDARTLALHLGSTDPSSAATVAAESGGSPFFVHELARHAAAGGGAVTLPDVVSARVRRLPPGARRLMTIVATSAQPIPPAVAERAAGVSGADIESVQMLGTARLTRVAGASDEPILEPYHDRIREAVLAAQTPTDRAACHRALADAWEASGLASPQTLTTHCLGCGDTLRAMHYAELAATRAAAALAFDQAAELYRLLINLADAHPRRRDWQVALGDTLVSCGRGYEAAGAFLAALGASADADADTMDVIEVERRAASELIRAGYLEEATQVLNRLLPKVGVQPPGGLPRAVVTMLVYRARLAWRGLHVTPVPEAQVPRAVLQRVDALVSIAPPLTLISLPRGLAVNLQAVWHSLEAGEPKRAAVGLALFASTVTLSGTKTYQRALTWVAQAKALAAPLNDPWTTARTELAEGICYKVSGFWQKGIAALEKASATFARCPGARWEIETAQTLRHDALIWTGEWRKLAAELPGRRHEAQQRGDLFSEAQVAGRLSPLMRLAEDRVDDARAEAQDAQRFYAQPHFNLQHRAALCSLLDIDLYGGQAREADRRLRREWSVLTGTLAMFQNGRIEAHNYRARIALTLAAQGDASGWARAARTARKLESEHAGYATALATTARASVAHGTGDVTTAVTLLRRAIAGFDEGDMRVYAACARWWLGRLLGGDEGDDIIEDAHLTMTAEGIVSPERIASLLVPGRWEHV